MDIGNEGAATPEGPFHAGPVAQSNRWDDGWAALETAVRRAVPRDCRSLMGPRVLCELTGDLGDGGTSIRMMRMLALDVLPGVEAGLQAFVADGRFASWRSSGVLATCVTHGGAAVLRVFLDGQAHYVVATGLASVDGVSFVEVWDPEAAFDERLVEHEVLPTARPWANRLVKMERLNRSVAEDYCMVSRANRGPDDPEVGEAYLFWYEDPFAGTVRERAARAGDD